MTLHITLLLLAATIAALISYNKLQLLRIDQINLSLFGAGEKWRKIKKYKRKLGKRVRRIERSKEPVHQVRARNRGKICDIDVYERTGMYEDDFMDLYSKIKHRLKKPRKGRSGRAIATSLAPEMRLVFALHHLRAGLPTKEMGILYDMDKGTVSRELHHTLPIILPALNFIRMPDRSEIIPHAFMNAVAAADCTSHFRNRVHPRQGDWYRGDKKGFFITSQLVCGLDGRIWRVDFGLGHNNDAGMVNRTGLRTFLEKDEDQFYVILADGGYQAKLFITPDDSLSDEWNHEQKSLRSVVEVVFSLIHSWRIATNKYQGSPEFQEISLMIVYQLTALQLKQFPLRIPS